MKYIITESQYNFLQEQTKYTDKKKYKEALKKYEVQNEFYKYFKSGNAKSSIAPNDSVHPLEIDYQPNRKIFDLSTKYLQGASTSNWANWPVFFFDFMYRKNNGMPSSYSEYQTPRKKVAIPNITDEDYRIFDKLIYSPYGLKKMIKSWKPRYDNIEFLGERHKVWVPIFDRPIKPELEVIVTTTTTESPIITTTTTSVPLVTTTTTLKTPFYDINSEKSEDVQCGLVLVKDRKTNRPKRIHRKSDGEFLGNYDSSKSGEANIKLYCKYY